MYPNTFFNQFPPFPRENKVFVAMSFDDRFHKRWEDVIKLAVENIKVNGIQLEPYRVDLGKCSDSILTEIFMNISNCKLFFADLTTIGQLNKNPIRNGNVMYEIGIAQAVRLPEEVILFRSDKDSLMFDLVNIRVNYYDPDLEPEDAKQKVNDVLSSAIGEINLKKHLSIQRVVDSLDFYCLSVLLNPDLIQGIVNGDILRTMRDLSLIPKINALNKLIELGILSTAYKPITPEDLPREFDKSMNKLLYYNVTSFGVAVIEELANRMDLFSPELQKHFEHLSAKKDFL